MSIFNGILYQSDLGSTVSLSEITDWRLVILSGFAFFVSLSPPPSSDGWVSGSDAASESEFDSALCSSSCSGM